MTEKTEPIQDGLQVNLDARNNAGSGQANNKTWRNLAGSSHHGIVQNLAFPATNDSGWHDNYLQLDGVDDFVNLEELNNSYQTLEVTFSADIASSAAKDIIGNWETGGGGIHIVNNKIRGEYYINGAYVGVESGIDVIVGTIYTVTLTYDGSTIKLYVNGVLKAQQTAKGTISKPDYATTMAIGCNPFGNTQSASMFKGKIYSARIYNRALSQDEVTYNYNTTYGIRKRVSIKTSDIDSGIVAYQFSSNANLTASSNGWTEVTKTTEIFTLTDVVVSADAKYFYVKDQAGNIKRFSTDDMNKYTITYNQNYITETGIEGNVLYNLNDKSSTTVTTGSTNAGTTKKATYSISNGTITVSALTNDGHVYTEGEVYLEKGRTYIFNCTTNGKWESTDAESGDTVGAFLMLGYNRTSGIGNSYDSYIRMQNNSYEFVPETSGYYTLRFDVNQSGKTYTFSNITIREKYTLDSVTKPEGSQIGVMPIPDRGDYEFDGWYTAPTGGTKITQDTVITSDLTLYARWREAPSEITYYLYGSGKGWLQDSGTGDNNMVGLTGQSLTNYGFYMKLSDRRLSGNIMYKIHQQTVGWSEEVDDGKNIGNESVFGATNKRIEAINIRLTGDLAKSYNIFYKVHCQSLGWLRWAKNGENAGILGYSYRVEAIKIRLVKKNQTAPTEDSTKNAFYSK